MTQVGVEIVHPPAIGKLAGIRMALVGGADTDCVRACQLTVYMIIGRCACEQVDLEGFAFFMELLGALRQCHSYNFRRTGRCEARHADIVSVFNITGRFLGRNKRDTHL